MKAYWPATLAGIILSQLAVLRVAYLYQNAIGPIYVDTGLYGFLLSILIFIIILPWVISPWVYFDITRRLVTRNLGLCTGLTVYEGTEALTPWLHDLIQRAAGRTVNHKPLTSNDPKSRPLTFGDLWDAPGFPPSWLKMPQGTKPRSIDLQMFSTNLSHGRPYIFPLSDRHHESTKYRDRERLYFSEDEMKLYLPPDVVKWMIDHSQPYTLEQGRQGKDPDPNDSTAQGLRELPEPKDFPVLLAARMSLSFPFLFAAVPLHAIDSESPGRRKFRRCWFSDGGISSHFPMHLFDGLVPMWPTFGLTLEPEIIGRGMVFVPEKYDQGYGERWNAIPDENQGAGKLGCFISSIISTLQNWNDNSLARMPGVRDRVARVRLKSGEGGMNLNMTASLIQEVSAKGVTAVDALLGRFATQPHNGKNINGWDEHRFVRLNVLRKMLEARSPGLVAAVSSNCKHATNFPTLFRKMRDATNDAGDPLPSPGFEERITDNQCWEMEVFVKALQALSLSLANDPNPMPFKPIPNPELRVRPPL